MFKAFKVLSPLLGAAALQAVGSGWKGGNRQPWVPLHSSRHQSFTAQSVTPRGIQLSPKGGQGQLVTCPRGQVALHPTSCPSTRTTGCCTPWPPSLSSAPGLGLCKLTPDQEQLKYIRKLQRAALISQTFNQYDAALFITTVKNMQKVPSGPTRYRA